MTTTFKPWIKPYKGIEMWEFWPSNPTMVRGVVYKEGKGWSIGGRINSTFSVGRITDWTGRKIRFSLEEAKKAVEKHYRSEDR